jgi:hypothetical protein
MKLNISFQSQTGNQFKRDCGPAVLGCLVNQPVADVLSRTGLQANEEFSFQSFYYGLRYYGLPFVYHNDLSAELLRQALAAGNPVIVLLNYGRLAKDLQATAYNGRHWTLVTGYNLKRRLFYVHDPLRTAEEGPQEWPEAELIAAMGDVRHGNLPNQGLIIKRTFLQTEETVLRRVSDASQAVAAEMKRVSEENLVLHNYLTQLYQQLDVSGSVGDPEAQGQALAKVLRLASVSE